MKKSFTILASILLLCLSAFAAGEEPQKVKPLWIHDGDTFTAVDRNRYTSEYRLWGVDAPELDQPWGKVARSVLIELVHRRNVRIVICGAHFQRTVARVETAGGDDIGLILLKMGLAWHEKRFAPDREDYAAAEAEARAARRGLWSAPSPVPPWEWRNRKKSNARTPKTK